MKKTTYSVIAWSGESLIPSFYKEGYKTYKGACKRMKSIQTDGQYYMATIRKEDKWTDSFDEVSTTVLHWESRFGITL